MSVLAPPETATATAPKKITLLTRGRRESGLTTLVSPLELGSLLKPFVFLDYGVVPPTGRSQGLHPHSGVATLTLVIGGRLTCRDTTGESGAIDAGGLEWFHAGVGAWHDGLIDSDQPLEFYQLWLALPETSELTPAFSQSIPHDAIERDGPVEVLLGHHGTAKSVLRAPPGIHFFHVRLRDGETWSYRPPADHDVLWSAVYQGEVLANGSIRAGELVVFDDTGDAIDFHAVGDAAFVVGSAVRHPHDLVTGLYSVHTNATALVVGETEIRRIAQAIGRSSPV